MWLFSCIKNRIYIDFYVIFLYIYFYKVCFYEKKKPFGENAVKNYLIKCDIAEIRKFYAIT